MMVQRDPRRDPGGEPERYALEIVAENGAAAWDGSEPAWLPGGERTQVSVVRAVLTDLHFWIPAVVLVLGLALLVTLSR